MSDAEQAPAATAADVQAMVDQAVLGATLALRRVFDAEIARRDQLAKESEAARAIAASQAAEEAARAAARQAEADAAAEAERVRLVAEVKAAQDAAERARLQALADLAAEAERLADGRAEQVEAARLARDAAERAETLARAFEAIPGALVMAQQIKADQHAVRNLKVAIFNPDGSYAGCQEGRADMIELHMADAFVRLAWRPEWDPDPLRPVGPRVPPLSDIPNVEAELIGQALSMFATQTQRSPL